MLEKDSKLRHNFTAGTANTGSICWTSGLILTINNLAQQHAYGIKGISVEYILIVLAVYILIVLAV